MKLYELSNQYQQLSDMINEECDIQAITDTLEGLQGEIEDKVDGMVKLMKSIEADEAGIKAEEERLYNRRQALQNRRESIKKYLECNLINAGIDKVKTPLFTVTIQNNPISLKVLVEAKLDNYFKYVPSLDKKKLLEDLKNGVVVDGAEIQQTRSIRIR